jgi:nucleoid-associated protein YejK
MKINHAILHVLDFESAVNVISQRELDLEDSRAARQFVTTHLRRARESGDNRRATFSDDSAFGGELKRFFYGERDFIDLSQQIAEFIGAELAKAERAQSTDVLVADFDDDDDVRWFAVMLLTSKQAFMHEVGTETGQTVNAISRRYAILPNPSQKVQSYAVVRASTMEIGYVDKKRKIAGEDVMLIPEGLLQCDAGVSGKEVIDTVTRVVEEVAEEHGANTAVALAKVKAAVAEKVEDDEELPPWDIVDEVFEDAPQSKESVKTALREERLPERVPVERKQVERAAVRNHKIRTDTGIEITFPAEMGSNSDYIEFVNEPNGLISIELKKISSIENR